MSNNPATAANARRRAAAHDPDGRRRQCRDRCQRGRPRRRNGARRRASSSSIACRRATRSRSRAIAAGEPVVRYGVAIGTAAEPIAAGRWVHERLLKMPAARSLEGLPVATRAAPALPPLAGYTFEGFRNADGSVGTRNILAITTTVQCVAGVVEHRGRPDQVGAAAALSERRRRRRPRARLRLWRRDRRARCADPDPDAAQHQPQPELRRRDPRREPRLREAAARATAATGFVRDPRRARGSPGAEGLDVVRLQDEAHVGFDVDGRFDPRAGVRSTSSD